MEIDARASAYADGQTGFLPSGTDERAKASAWVREKATYMRIASEEHKVAVRAFCESCRRRNGWKDICQGSQCIECRQFIKDLNEGL